MKYCTTLLGKQVEARAKHNCHTVPPLPFKDSVGLSEWVNNRRVTHRDGLIASPKADFPLQMPGEIL
jgi:hypothetical protein